MARERKKAEQPVGVQPSEEAAAAAFSGLAGEDAPLPMPASSRGRGAAKGVGVAPTPEVGAPPAKPRARKAPLSASPTGGTPQPATDWTLQARETGALLESILQQCREAQAQLQRELEERYRIERETEALRQRSQATHEQLLHDAQEARHLHQELMAEAKEARAAHEQLLSLARECAEQVKREQTAAVERLTTAGHETRNQVEQSREAHEQLLREQSAGVAHLKAEWLTTAKQVAEVGRHLESFLGEVEEARESHQRGASEAAAQVKRECAVAARQFAEAGEQVTEVRDRFFEGFEQEVARLHQHLREAGQSMQELPRHAEEVRHLLAEVAAEARTLEQTAASARQKRESLDHETQQVDQHLASLRTELADTEGRLAALRLEWESSQRRPEPAKPAREPVVEEVHREVPPPAPPEPETRNHLGITVDPGVVVAEVTPGTPAADAGLIRGDVITAVNGMLVLSGPELRDLILDEADGVEILLSLTRGGHATEARIHFTVGEEKQLGATVESGVVVAEVTPGTPGAVAGLSHGDVIHAVNGEEVFTGAQLRDAVQALEGRSEVTLRFTRIGEGHEITTRLEEVPALA